MGILPVDTAIDITQRALTRATVARAERALDARVDVIDAPALSEAAARSAANAGHVLLVSGFAGTTTGLGPIARTLVRDGFAPPTLVGIPDGGLAPAAEGVRALDAAIRALPTGEPIHLAGHSKGGVVAQSWYDQAPAELRERVQSITLIESSNTGQTLSLAETIAQRAADLVTGPFGSVVAETQATSPTMARIANMSLEPGTRPMSIISTNDGLLDTAEAHWAGAKNVVIDGDDAPSHIEALVHPRVYQEFRDHLLDG